MLKKIVPALIVLWFAVVSLRPVALVPALLGGRVDTSLSVTDESGRRISYATYFKLLYRGEHYLEIAPNAWKLKRYPDSAVLLIRKYYDRLDSASRVKNIRYRLSRADQVLVIKSARKLYIRRGDKDMFVFPVNLGKNPIGHKSQEGDGRTPEGKYRLELKSWVAQYYLNFHISYPDSADLERAKRMNVKSGGSVMIHGTSASRLGRKDWTNGCIALTNAQMDTLFKYVPVNTEIEIRK